MAVTVVNIIPSKQAEAAQTTQYTASNCKTIIDKFTITNTSSSNVTFSCNLVPLSGSASDSNLIIDARGIAPGETYNAVELVGQTLESGGFISTLAGTASALTIRSSGREIT
ncbi:MAG: hypothetical protein PVI43_01040 [Candidatus Bathyarchaeota archaeon]|jgi:hypothetical protein